MVNPWFGATDDLKNAHLLEFATESNLIESITSEAAHEIHAKALYEFVHLPKIRLADLEKFVKTIEPNAFLRTEPNHMVSIGGELAPSPMISLSNLDFLLKKINNNDLDPWVSHADYECIHPFIDGNGRSGRAIWCWQMLRFHLYTFKYNFLQYYYYQTLSKYRAREGFKI